MKRFYYYAELNDNDICVRIISSVEIMTGARYVEIPEFNETLYRYKKWLGDQWSATSYEPEIDTVIQDKIAELEQANDLLKQENTNLQLALTELAETSEIKVTELQLALAELAELGV